MAEVSELPQLIEGGKPGESGSAEDMDLVTESPQIPQKHSNGAAKRGREGGDADEVEDGDSKKQKVEKSVEEERLEKLEEKTGEEEDSKEEVEEEEGGNDEKESGSASLGPKVFCSSVEMLNYFIKFLHFWPPNLDINKYEHMVLLDLLKKGHSEPDKKIGEGIQTFQVRYHPMFKSRCFFLLRADGSEDDFSFRKCVDKILPLPDNMKPQSASDGNKVFNGNKTGGYHKGGGQFGGGGRGGRGGGGRGGGGRGRRGGFRK